MRTLWFPCKAAYPQEVLCIDTSLVLQYGSFFAPGLKLALYYDVCTHLILAVYAKDL